MVNQTDYYFRRTGSFIEKEISLDNVDLQILALIEQNKSARQITKELNISPALMKHKIMALHKQQVIKLVENNYDCMDQDFSEHIRKTLIDMVGPLGSLLLDDALDGLNLETDNIPKIIAKDIIRMIAKEIPDEEHSEKFTAIMLAELTKK